MPAKRLRYHFPKNDPFAMSRDVLLQDALACGLAQLGEHGLVIVAVEGK